MKMAIVFISISCTYVILHKFRSFYGLERKHFIKGNQNIQYDQAIKKIRSLFNSSQSEF